VRKEGNTARSKGNVQATTSSFSTLSSPQVSALKSFCCSFSTSTKRPNLFSLHRSPREMLLVLLAHLRFPLSRHQFSVLSAIATINEPRRSLSTSFSEDLCRLRPLPAPRSLRVSSFVKPDAFLIVGFSLPEVFVFLSAALSRVQKALSTLPLSSPHSCIHRTTYKMNFNQPHLDGAAFPEGAPHPQASSAGAAA
jgi:hypothetical protein